MAEPSSIVIEHDWKYNDDLLYIVSMLLRRGYDVLLREEDSGTVVSFDYAAYKGYGNPTFEYVDESAVECLSFSDDDKKINSKGEYV